ncbi:MAG TPA: D-2-hydroxyacid dehydrogenase [Gammaproteobacteria bacterium]|nr:D-2-hydroxyacid dehydrogenase [Gammaproteobacteria bacterium]
MRGVFLDWATVSNNDVNDAPLHAVLDTLTLYPVTAQEQVAERVNTAQVILTNKLRIDETVINAAKDLQLICLSATGFDNVAIEAARARGIAVTNIRDYCTAAVAQHVFALILSLNQHLTAYQQLLAAGDWRRSPQFTLLDFPITELAGKTLGIVGYGTLGKAVAKLGEAFGMNVVLARRPGDENDTRPGRFSLATLIKEADVLSLHCPLTPATQQMIGVTELAAMKSNAILINTARGALVDESALANALREKQIGGAGVDVLSQEPPVNGNPLLADDIPNLIVTPHIAWATQQARQRAVSEMAENIAAFKRGENRNRVD